MFDVITCIADMQQVDESVVGFEIVKPVRSVRESFSRTQQLSLEQPSVATVSEMTEVKPESGVSNEIGREVLSPPASHAPVSWSFTQLATLEDEKIENLVSVQIPSPQNHSAGRNRIRTGQTG